MNKEQTDFLLKYAKIGVLNSKDSIDEIEYDELKDTYSNIKKQLTETENEVEVKKELKKPEDGKESAVGKWFKGISGRQKAYQEKQKGKGSLV